MMRLDLTEILTRVLRYIFLGLATALAGVYLIKGAKMEEVVLVALTVAASLAILDLAAPSISSGARLGLGAKIGASLAGLPAGF